MSMAVPELSQEDIQVFTVIVFIMFSILIINFLKNKIIEMRYKKKLRKDEGNKLFSTRVKADEYIGAEKAYKKIFSRKKENEKILKTFKIDSRILKKNYTIAIKEETYDQLILSQEHGDYISRMGGYILFGNKDVPHVYIMKAHLAKTIILMKKGEKVYVKGKPKHTD